MDHYGEVVDVFFKDMRRAKATKQLFKQRLKKNQSGPWEIVTEKLKSYGVVYREPIVGNDALNGKINQQQS